MGCVNSPHFEIKATVLHKNGEDMKETIQYFSQKKVGLALLEPHAKYIDKTCLNEEFDTCLSNSQTTKIKRTVLFGLVNNRFGLHILSCTPEVVDLIDAEVLNKAVEDEGTKGVSPLYLLSSNIEGRRLIHKSQQVEKISKSGLNRIVFPNARRYRNIKPTPSFARNYR